MRVKKLMTLVALVASLAISAVALAACSSSSAGSGSSTSSTRSTTSSTTAATSSSTTTTTIPVPPPDVQAMLLTLREMPLGWVRESTSGGSNPVGCNFKKVPGKPLATASASYGRRTGVPEFEEELAAEAPAKAASDMGKALSQLAACHALTIPAAGTLPAIKLAASRRPFRRVGDQSALYAFSGSIAGQTFTIYALLARFRSVEAVFAYANAGADETALSAFVTRASERIRAELG